MNYTNRFFRAGSRARSTHLLIVTLLFISAPFLAGAAEFPLSESFDGTQPANWILESNAVWDTAVGGEQALRLTTAAEDQSGLGFLDSSFSSNNGIVAEFRYYADEGDGADGIAFFLVDGDLVDAGNIAPGAFGGSLGYAQNDAPTDGIPHAYLGIGFDEFGNFVVDNEGKEGGLSSTVPHSVGLRGSGNGTDGYAYLTSTDISSTLGQTIDGGWRQARVTIQPHTGSSTVRVEMSFDDGATWDTVIDDYTYTEAPPDNLKLGFTGSTGGSTNVHAISELDVTLPVDLETIIDTTPSGPYQRGDLVEYSYTVTNNGPNDSATTTITNSMPIGSSGFTNIQWSATTSNSTLYSGTDSTLSPFVLPLMTGESVDVAITAEIGEDVVDSDNLDHTIIASPHTSRTDPNPNIAQLSIPIATDVPTQAASDARDIIEEFAATDGGSTAPTVSDYTDAGVSGVDSDNLDDINTLLAEKNADEVDTVAKIQSVVTAGDAIHTIKAYSATDGASSTPAIGTYSEAGITGVTTNNLTQVNTAIADSSVQTVSDIQSVVDTAVATYTIQQYAATDGGSSAPTVADYEAAGVQDVTSDNLDAVNADIAAKSADEVDTIDTISSSVSQTVERQTTRTRRVSSSGGRRYGCNDPDATNYTSYATHRAELCEYDEDTDATQSDQADRPTMTDAEIRTQIDELVTQINALRERITGTTPATTSSCSSFSRDLERGHEGDDVRCLQQALNSLDFTLAESGPGSPNNETSYFGALTFTAVSRYQEANAERVLTPIGLSSATGYFGPQTIAALEADIQQEQENPLYEPNESVTENPFFDE